MKSGKYPIAERRATAPPVPTFGAMADAAPMRAKPVDQVTTEDVIAVLKSLWIRRPETASRLRGRI